MGLTAPRVREPGFARLLLSVVLLLGVPWSGSAQGLHTPEPPAAVDQRRTIRAFPTNLGRSLVGVFSERSLLPLAVGGAATAAAAVFDSRAESALVGSCLSCGKAGTVLGGAAVVIPSVGALFVAGRLAPPGRFRAATYDLAQAAIITQVYANLLKVAVRRERPDGSDRLSFPSDHATTAFGLAAVVESHYGWKLGVPAYILASGIGLSRVESNRHRLSEVLAGATLGIIVGRTVTRRDGQSVGRRTVVSLRPATDGSGGGEGLALWVTW